ncbi:MAG: VCBS repeat-containing protein [Bacteroidales bacterium]
MKSLVPCLLAFAFFAPWGSLHGQSAYPAWKHISIDPVLPGSSWGTGGPALCDFDGDGDLDVAISRRNTRLAYWYERRNDSLWISHLMGEWATLDNTLGTTVVDVNRDGLPDVLFNGVWFRNPGRLDEYPDQRWTPQPIKAGGHDAATADVDGNGVDDILVYDGNKLAWYNPSDALREHVISSGHRDHGGMAPRGFGDLDGDGDLDVLVPGLWFANPGRGDGVWERNNWPFDSIPGASYGPSIRSWVTDFDGDGDMDIIYSHCDTGGSRVVLVLNQGRGSRWEVVALPDPPTRPGDVPGTGSFHALGVADFNGDGLLDVFAGEQEDPDTYMESSGKVAMKPRGLKERGIIWYQTGSPGMTFHMDVIQVDNPGWHDVQLGDVDGDGDVDLVSKIWNADGPAYHLDYWQNRLEEEKNP